MNEFLQAFKALATFEKGYTNYPRSSEIAYSAIFWANILILVYLTVII